MPKYAEEILAAVTELQRHPTAEQVFLEMKREHPRIALGTVYKLGDAEQKPLLRQTVQVLIYRTQSNAGVLLFHLQEHLLRRGMPLQLRDGGQYLLCIFWHTAPLQKQELFLFLLFIIRIFNLLSTAMEGFR